MGRGNSAPLRAAPTNRPDQRASGNAGNTAGQCLHAWQCLYPGGWVGEDRGKGGWVGPVGQQSTSYNGGHAGHHLLSHVPLDVVVVGLAALVPCSVDLCV